MTPDLASYWREAFDADKRLIHDLDARALPARELAVLGIIVNSPVTREQAYEWLTWVTDASVQEPALRKIGEDNAAG